MRITKKRVADHSFLDFTNHIASTLLELRKSKE